MAAVKNRTSKKTGTGSKAKPSKPARSSAKVQRKSPKTKSARRGRKPASGSSRTAVATARMDNPSRITTGTGAGPEQIGRELVAMFNRGMFREIEEKFWSPDIVSVEGMGMAWHGREAVEQKNQGWLAQNQILGASAEGPFVGAGGFAVKFRMDVLDKSSGQSTVMDEVGVYQVQNGKIVREEFMYGPASSAGSPS